MRVPGCFFTADVANPIKASAPSGYSEPATRVPRLALRVTTNLPGGVGGSGTVTRMPSAAHRRAMMACSASRPRGVGRPYDLPHACITRWLNAGVPIAEVARRVGNSPEVIHRRYHGCIDGHEEAANAKISKALEEDGDETQA